MLSIGSLDCITTQVCLLLTFTYKILLSPSSLIALTKRSTQILKLPSQIFKIYSNSIEIYYSYSIVIRSQLFFAALFISTWGGNCQQISYVLATAIFFICAARTGTVQESTGLMDLYLFWFFVPVNSEYCFSFRVQMLYLGHSYPGFSAVALVLPLEAHSPFLPYSLSLVVQDLFYVS